MKSIFVLTVASLFSACSGGFGPVYPITAAWFKDRFSVEEWNVTLSGFSEMGGDTVLLRAPSITTMSLEDIRRDPEFKWCIEEGRPCYDVANEELSNLGLDVVLFGKFLYEEDFNSDAMLQCQQFDRKIITSMVYYRLVLPLEPVKLNTPCDLTNSKVMVLFTSFSGIDPHELLLQSAEAHNMSVYFGLPLPQISYETDQLLYTIPYYEFVRRLTRNHQAKYGADGKLYGLMKGYTFSPPFDMMTSASSDHIEFLRIVSSFLKTVNKQLLLKTYFQTNLLIGNGTLDRYMSAYEAISRSGFVDIMSVHDGRGNAVGGYFWLTQSNTQINRVDKNLFQILESKFPEDIQENVTFSEVFSTSINQMFYHFAATRDRLVNNGADTQLWLNIEAFSDLHDDPCLPVDKAGSGLDRMLDRVSKSRLDLALTHAGAYVQKVASLAWDPSFTCKTKNISTPLSRQVSHDLNRPIIANCSFHSSFNRSVVVIGYNLAGLTQGFTVNWPRVDGRRQTSQVHGYYFELDWGEEHQRVPSLMYTQLYDPYDIVQLAPKGYVTVGGDGAHHACAFKYDYTNSPSVISNHLEKMKRFYFTDRTPRKRVFGQNSPRL